MKKYILLLIFIFIPINVFADGVSKPTYDFVNQYRQSVVLAQIENTLFYNGGLSEVVIINLDVNGFVLVQKYTEGNASKKSNEGFYVYYTKIIFPKNIRKVNLEE